MSCNLIHGQMPCMKFLCVRSDVCRQLLSDSTSRWTPLLLAIRFPLLGLVRDLHPLEQTHAEHTKRVESFRIPLSYLRLKNLELVEVSQLVVRMKNILDFVAIEINHVLTSLTAVLTWVEVLWVQSKCLTNTCCESKTRV